MFRNYLFSISVDSICYAVDKLSPEVLSFSVEPYVDRAWRKVRYKLRGYVVSAKRKSGLDGDYYELVMTLPDDVSAWFWLTSDIEAAVAAEVLSVITSDRDMKMFFDDMAADFCTALIDICNELLLVDEIDTDTELQTSRI
ncbi:MAG: hypothetical protein J1F05_05455 [Muribaculaceae bacterium]|nr:hypothetical protein [Muribaculaceae bacterium]